MKNIIIILFSVLMLFSGCSRINKQMQQGKWRGILLIDKTDSRNELPFIFEFSKTGTGGMEMTIINADEKIKADEVTMKGDSVFIKMPVFKDEIHAKIIRNDSLAGQYFHFGSKSSYGIPFYATTKQKNRFSETGVKSLIDVSGRWETTMQPGDSDEYKIIGEFRQTGSRVTGTFLTTSGDYRYLEGIAEGNKFLLSCIDGAHTLLFKAEITPDGKLDNGVLIGGPAWVEKWQAVKNENAKLPDPEKQSSIKEGTGTVDFKFKDLNGNDVSLSDKKFAGKNIVLQIMGSWCPNCMDETRLYSELYKTYKDKGFEFIGLCFESNNYDESKARIERFVNQLNAGYTFLYAGEVGNKQVLTALPFMKDFKGYPTTIYLDKNHKPLKVFTGFSGPGTGEHYEKLKTEIINYLNSLES
ncbi:MAG TPA: TlpA disulfide reductase family protein [Ignavibacteria bacterium]|nr:TlpA disulfide reductase family protein [Ignavibacteria bacterium]